MTINSEHHSILRNVASRHCDRHKAKFVDFADNHLEGRRNLGFLSPPNTVDCVLRRATQKTFVVPTLSGYAVALQLSMPIPLPFADAGDIVRATTKDEEYITLFEASIRELLLCTLPNSTTSSPITARLVSTTARLLYFLSPIRRRLPTTPGEEYAAIVPVRVTALRTTLPAQRIFAALALSHLIKSEDLQRGLRFVWELLGERVGSFPSDAAAGAVDAAGRLHTAVFYMFGAFHDVGHRVLELRHVRIAPRLGGTSLGRLRLLGLLVAVQVAVDAGRGLRKAVARARRGVEGRVCYPGHAEFLKRVTMAWVRPREIEEEGEEEGQSKCILCLCGMKDATLTSCGHVFCWKCICNWCSSNVSWYQCCEFYTASEEAMLTFYAPFVCLFLCLVGNLPALSTRSCDEEAGLFVQLLKKRAFAPRTFCSEKVSQRHVRSFDQK